MTTSRIPVVLLTLTLLSHQSFAADVFKVVPPESVGLDGSKLEQIDDLMRPEVDSGRIAGCLALVAREGKVAYFKTWGHRDREQKLAMTDDTIFRIYSMSKPITSVAVMQLVEQGKLKLDDPVSKYLPEWKEMQVLVGAGDDAKRVPAERAITVRDLLRHTSGLTYGFFGNTPVDQAYRKALVLSEFTIEQTVKKLGKLPLLYHPGTRWHYSVSTDVLGRLVEVVSGEAFDKYLHAHIFKPLAMTDTFFTLPKDRLPRFAQMYSPDGANKLKPSNAFESIRFVVQANRFHSGGGGLCATTRDYLRFCQTLLNGGELDGVRILKAETIREMTTDQLKDISSGAFKFGLGFAIGSEGEYSWGGAAGTRFWIDPKRKVIGIHMLQIKPFSRNYVDRLKQIVNGAVKSIKTTAKANGSRKKTASSWPQFRGPNADGVAPANPGLPLKWSLTENVQWFADVPGLGWSCPTIVGGKVFLTTVVADEANAKPSKGLYLGQGVRTPSKGMHHWLVYCFDLNTGKELWKHEAHSGRPKVPRHPKSTYAVETACSDGERLYVLFGDLGLYCYDLNGKPLWSESIEAKKTFFDYGAAASPVVHEGQVFVVYDNREDSWLAAFDAKSGQENWRTARKPFVWKNKLRTEIVVPGRNRNRSYSLDGKLLWEFDGKMSNLVIPSPFAAHGLCYIASGYVGDAHRPTFAIKPGASGDISPKPTGNFADSEFIAWYQGTSSAYNPSQIVYGDQLYTLYDRGFLTAHDARTGDEVFEKVRFSPRGSFTSSPWAYNGHVLFLSEDGLTYVVKAGKQYELVGTNDLAELCLSTPAVAGNKLLIRTTSRLFCLTEGAKPESGMLARLQALQAEKFAVDIWTAAASGDLSAIKDALAKGVDANAKKPGEETTALNIAALHGRLKSVKLLLTKGADVSVANPDGNTALHIAAFFTYSEIVEELLRHGAKADVKNRRGETPINVVSAAWDPNLERIYQSITNAVGLKLNLNDVKKRRPIIAERLSKQAAKQ